MKLVVGLGNPTEEYNNTRHNVGFMFLDKYYSQFKLSKKFKAMDKTISIDNEKVILVKPETFMNNSGESIILYKNYYKLNDDDILVIHDDMDISLGDYKISYGKGDAGHNGIKSIINHLGSKNFYRVRIGISKYDNDMKDYVLSKFSSSDIEKIEDVFTKLDSLIIDFIKLNKNDFMKKYNTK